MVPFKPGSNKLMGNEFRKTGGHPVLHVSLRGEISSTFQLVVPGSGKNNMRNAKMLCGGLQAAWQRFSLRGVCLDSLSVQMLFYGITRLLKGLVLEVGFCPCEVVWGF